MVGANKKRLALDLNAIPRTTTCIPSLAAKPKHGISVTIRVESRRFLTCQNKCYDTIRYDTIRYYRMLSAQLQYQYTTRAQRAPPSPSSSPHITPAAQNRVFTKQATLASSIHFANTPFHSCFALLAHETGALLSFGEPCFCLLLLLRCGCGRLCPCPCPCPCP